MSVCKCPLFGIRLLFGLGLAIIGFYTTDYQISRFLPHIDNYTPPDNMVKFIWPFVDKLCWEMRVQTGVVLCPVGETWWVVWVTEGRTHNLLRTCSKKSGHIWRKILKLVYREPSICLPRTVVSHDYYKIKAFITNEV